MPFNEISPSAVHFFGAHPSRLPIETPQEVIPTFIRLVFIGASILEDLNPGVNLTQRNTTFESLLASSGAPGVEVYSNAVGGHTAEQSLAKLVEAMNAFPSDTLFFVHTGGNNVSDNRPYPGGAAALQTALTALIAQANTRPGSVLISDLTFRDYSDTTADDEDAGSKPYNDNVYKPLMQSNLDALVGRAYYADGTAVSSLYEWSYYNADGYLSADNIHPSTNGVTIMQAWLAERLAPILAGSPIPEQATRLTLSSGPVALGSLPDLSFTVGQAISSQDLSSDFTPNSGLTFAISSGTLPSGLSLSTSGQLTGTPTTEVANQSLTVRATDALNRTATSQFGITVNSASVPTTIDALVSFGGDIGVPNEVGLNHIDSEPFGVSATSFGPFALEDVSGASTSLQLSVQVDRLDTGGADGIGPNYDGAATGVAAFDSTLYNDVVLSDSVFIQGPGVLTLTITGLEASTDYDLSFAASRATGGARQTLISFADASTTVINNTSVTPPETPVSVTKASNSSGVMVITVEPNSGTTYGYLGGLRIKKD